MRDDGANGNLEGLIEPVDVKNEDEVGNNIGNQKNPPVGEKNQIPRKESGQNLEQSMDDSVVLNKKFAHRSKAREKWCPTFNFRAGKLFFNFFGRFGKEGLECFSDFE